MNRRGFFGLLSGLPFAARASAVPLPPAPLSLRAPTTLFGVCELLGPGLRCFGADTAPGTVFDLWADLTADRIVIAGYRWPRRVTRYIHRQQIEDRSYIGEFRPTLLEMQKELES